MKSSTRSSASGSGGTRKSAQKKKANGPSPDKEWPWHFFGREEAVVERAYLVDKLLPKTGVVLISGQWGCYKSFIALDLAAAVITGTPFAGFETKRQGAVLLIALEAEGEISIRARAAFMHHGYLQKTAPFAWIDVCPRLLDQNAGETLVAMVRQAADIITKDSSLPLALVIIDTAGKAAGYLKSGDENDAVIGRQIVAALAFASRQTEALFVGIEHFGKDAETGTRGTSAKESDCDAVLALLGEKSVSGEVKNPRLAVRKRRSGANGVEISFQPRVVPAGDDDETTIVIDWRQADEAAAAAKPDKWGKALRLLRQTLMNALIDCGSHQRPFHDGPMVRAADVEAVRSEFYKSYAAEGTGKQKAAARRQAFNRAINEAQARGLVGIREIGTATFVWFAKQDEAGL